jgi:hypothetical protein
MERLRELKEEKLKWLIALAVFMVVGMLCIAFAIVAIRVGYVPLIAAFLAAGVIDIFLIAWVVKKKFGEIYG